MIQPPLNAQRLLERFLRYVKVDTTADERSKTYPSSPGQWDLGKILVAELREIGLADIEQDEFALVWGTLPSNLPQSHKVPAIAFNAHLDTSPETTGKGVKPQVHRKYDGRDITLPGDPSRVITVAANPELAELVGQTIITTDGTTLLGSDDKSGIAVIMEAIAWLAEHPEIPHGPIKVLFTCDEEIGHGVDHVDLKKLGATVAYTLDGSGTDDVDVETFSADLALVTVRGVNIHPSIGKGRMVNAVRAAADFVSRLPRDGASPETTDGREGFLHPYQMSGGVAEVTMRILLRSFDTPKLAEYATLLKQAAAATMQSFIGCSVDIEIVQQYRNMGDGLTKEPRAVAYAEEAMRRLGREPRRTIIRGGTDGSRFTELGLPTPNLSTGEHNPHSPLEWTCLEEMATAAEVLTVIAQVWAEQSQ